MVLVEEATTELEVDLKLNSVVFHGGVSQRLGVELPWN